MKKIVFRSDIEHVFQLVEQQTSLRESGKIDWSSWEAAITNLLKCLPELVISPEDNDGDAIHVLIDVDKKVRLSIPPQGAARMTPETARSVADFIRSLFSR